MWAGRTLPGTGRDPGLTGWAGLAAAARYPVFPRAAGLGARRPLALPGNHIGIGSCLQVEENRKFLLEVQVSHLCGCSGGLLSYIIITQFILAVKPEQAGAIKSPIL